MQKTPYPTGNNVLTKPTSGPYRMFRITDIPDVMEKKEGWPVGAAMMRRWFNSPAYTMSEDVKAGRTGPAILSPDRIDESIITMKWARKYQRFNSAYHALLNGSWMTTPGIKTLRKCVLQSKPSPIHKQWRLGNLALAGKYLDEICQVNYVPVGNLNDPLDDFYAALGQCNLKIAVTGVVTESNGGHQIVIDEVGLYIRDTYDFNDGWFPFSQPLGFWGFDGVERSIQLAWDVEVDERYSDEPEPAGRKYAVQNDDFRNYRARYGRGGDFVVFSDVQRVQINPITIDL